MAKKGAGFTIVELVTVIAIIAIMAAMALPKMNGMIKDYHLRSAARQLISSLQQIKLRAIKENTATKILIQQDPGTGAYYYQLFVDIDGDNTIDAGEDFNRVDVRSDLAFTQLGVNPIGFTGRGMPSNGNGTITISLIGGRGIDIVLNSAGNIKID